MLPLTAWRGEGEMERGALKKISGIAVRSERHAHTLEPRSTLYPRVNGCSDLDTPRKLGEQWGNYWKEDSTGTMPQLDMRFQMLILVKINQNREWAWVVRESSKIKSYEKQSCQGKISLLLHVNFTAALPNKMIRFAWKFTCVISWMQVTLGVFQHCCEYPCYTRVSKMYYSCASHIPLYFSSTIPAEKQATSICEREVGQDGCLYRLGPPIVSLI